MVSREGWVVIGSFGSHFGEVWRTGESSVGIRFSSFVETIGG